MRSLLVAALLCLVMPVAAQQSGTVTFDPPTTGGVPTGYRLYRDNVLVGPVTSGQTVANLFPANTGAWAIAVESFNTAGPGPRVTKTVTLGPPPIQPPGPVINVVIDAPCAKATPPTCTVNITSP